MCHTPTVNPKQQRQPYHSIPQLPHARSTHMTPIQQMKTPRKMKNLNAWKQRYTIHARKETAMQTPKKMPT